MFKPIGVWSNEKRAIQGPDRSEILNYRQPFDKQIEFRSNDCSVFWPLQMFARSMRM
jgi:hypothetical protein